MRRPVTTHALAAAVAVALTLAACGGDDAAGGDEAGDTSTTTDAETTTTEDPREALEAEIVAAYEASWTDFIRAGDPPKPDAPFLGDHLSGDALTISRNLLHEAEAEGVVVRGTYEFDARVTELADDRAVVEDCGFDQMEVVNPGSGEVVERHDSERDGVVAELTREGSTWKVIKYTNDDQVCG